MARLCFVSSPVLPHTNVTTPSPSNVRVAPPLCLARRRTFKNAKGKSQQPAPPPQPTPEQRAALEETAKAFGVDTSPVLKTEPKKKGRPFYAAAEKAIGRDALNATEGVFVFILALLLLGVLACGIAVSLLAYKKTVGGGTAPEALEDLVNSIEPLFSPTMVTFLVGSATYGLFKQSQMRTDVEDASK